MALNLNYRQGYSTSRALVIGINDYLHANPLSNAKQDAEAVAAKLISECNFTDENVELLLDGDATKTQILERYRAFLLDGTSADDRIIFFFAGHGHTHVGNRGEVGYLVPSDGEQTNPNTLIRWDELTKDAELINAKHVFFIIDACFGGLAVTRSFHSGASRFLKDMYQRLSRQVLTAGKADEPVSDGNGPLPGHSVFTGHLLNGLSGDAEATDGVITAYSLTSYVYLKVSNDRHSRQTPHFSHLDGDGDVILKIGSTAQIVADDATGKDILIDFSNFSLPVFLEARSATTEEQLKELLSEPKKAIALNDLVTKEVRSVSSKISDQVKFNAQKPFADDGLFQRMEAYEKETADLTSIVILMSRWGEQQHLSVFKKIFDRLTDTVVRKEGYVVLTGMQWYPLMLEFYYAGIAAVSSDNFGPLKAALLSKIAAGHDGKIELIIPTVRGILELERHEIFKKLKGHERFHTPRSEYLYKLLQPNLEDLLYLGNSYEASFDRWEMLYALVYADIAHSNYALKTDKQADQIDVWGPIGRFGWKVGRGGGGPGGENPWNEMLTEAAQLKDKWPPIASGLFGGSYTRFQYIAGRFKSELLDRLHWF